jgi:hypothetical protein
MWRVEAGFSSTQKGKRAYRKLLLAGIPFGKNALLVNGSSKGREWEWESVALETRHRESSQHIHGLRISWSELA